MIKLDVWLGVIYWLRSIIWVSLYIILICEAVRATPCWQYLWLSASHLTNQSFPSNLVNIGQTSDIETRYQPCPASLSHITAPALTRPGRLETDGSCCWGEPAWLEGWAPCWCLPVSPVLSFVLFLSFCPPSLHLSRRRSWTPIEMFFIVYWAEPCEWGGYRRQTRYINC